MFEARSKLTVGTMLDGRYELEHLLGEGGFGVVYRARQVSTGQPVAIKCLHQRHIEGSSLANQAIERFEREMRVIARLKHPNIVRLIDSGKLDDGTLYTVIEYVDGRDLASVLAAEGRLGQAEACRLMGQVLEALSCAHEAGVVHRDLKPENIMIARSGARRNALVLDFGIAGLVEPADTAGADTVDAMPAARLTATGQFIGTPAYMAPEQFSGQPPTCQTDLYSWGLVFLEALTGRVAIEASSLPELLMKHMSDEPVPMPASLAQHPLGRVIERATAKSLSARFPTATETINELERCAVHASPDPVVIDIDQAVAFTETGDVGEAVEQLRGAQTGIPLEPSMSSTGPGTLDDAAPAANAHSVPEAEAVSVSAPPSSSKLLVAVVALVVLVLVGVGALLVVLSMDEPPDSAEAASDPRDEQPRGATTPSPASDVAETAVEADTPAVSPTDDDTPSAPVFEAGVVYEPEGTRGGAMLWVPGGTLTAPADLQTRLASVCATVQGEASDCRLAPLAPAATVEPFLLDRVEVSNAVYQACVDDGVCPAIDYGRCLLMGRDGDFAVHTLTGEGLERIVSSLGGAQLPASCVSAAEAERFCRWAGKRLPTDSQWTLAASVGGRHLFPWGDAPPQDGHANGADASLSDAMRWRRSPPVRLAAEVDDSEPFAAAVGSFPAGATPSGHLDLAGNVREWVATEDDSPRLPDTVRGGGWADAGIQLSGWAHSTLAPETRRADLGLRCALPLTQPVR